MTSPPCLSPLPFEALVDYWAGVSADEQAALEEHIFSCASCADRLAALAELARRIPKVAARRGGLEMSLTKSMVDRLAADGVRMRHYHATPGQITQCTIGAEDDLLVSHLSADLRGVHRADVVMQDASGRTLMRMHDAAIDSKDGWDAVADGVIFAIAGDVARTFPAMTFHVKLLALEPTGERTVAQYSFEHTPGA